MVWEGNWSGANFCFQSRLYLIHVEAKVTILTGYVQPNEIMANVKDGV